MENLRKSEDEVRGVEGGKDGNWGNWGIRGTEVTRERKSSIAHWRCAIRSASRLNSRRKMAIADAYVGSMP